MLIRLEIKLITFFTSRSNPSVSLNTSSLKSSKEYSGSDQAWSNSSSKLQDRNPLDVGHDPDTGTDSDRDNSNRRLFLIVIPSEILCMIR